MLARDRAASDKRNKFHSSGPLPDTRRASPCPAFSLASALSA